MQSRTFWVNLKKLTHRLQTANFRGVLVLLFGFLLIPIIILVSQLNAYSQTAGYTRFEPPLNGRVPDVWISNQFSQQESTWVRAGFAILTSMLRNDSDRTIGTLESRIEDCVRRYASNSFAASASVSQASNPVTRFNENLNIARGVLPARRLPSGNFLRRERRRIYVDRFYEQNAVLGSANVGINWNNGDFRIGLNAFQLAQSTSANLGEWAGTIIHEIMHNMGYDHPEIIDGNFEPVRGNLTYETGWCVKRRGGERPEGAFGLTVAEGGTDFFVD